MTPFTVPAPGHRVGDQEPPRPAAPVMPTVPSSPALSEPTADAETRAQKIIDAWRATLGDSPLSRATDAWNFVQSRMATLKTLIEQEL